MLLVHESGSLDEDEEEDQNPLPVKKKVPKARSSFPDNLSISL